MKIMISCEAPPLKFTWRSAAARIFGNGGKPAAPIVFAGTTRYRAASDLPEKTQQGTGNACRHHRQH
jgi:hypothetical protein